MSRLTDSFGAIAKIAPTTRADQIILAELCGRSYRGIFAVAEELTTAPCVSQR